MGRPNQAKAWCSLRWRKSSNLGLQSNDPPVGAFCRRRTRGPRRRCAREAALAQPTGLCLYGRYLFFADSETSSIRLLDLKEYKVGTVVGQGLFDFGDVDGSAGDVRLQHPMALTAAQGRLFHRR